MSIADELEKLEALRSSGAINDQEFAQAKALVLKGMPSTVSLGGAGLSSNPARPTRYDGLHAPAETNGWEGYAAVWAFTPKFRLGLGASVSACCFCHLASDWFLTSFFGSLCR